MPLSLVGLLAWALVAHAVPPSPEASSGDPGIPFRLSAAQAQQSERPRVTRFHVASFNVLGYNHTAKGGDRAGMADGRQRMEYAYRIMKNQHVNVVGFQELQPQQFEKFNKMTGKRWSVYPGARFERIAMHNSIAWKTSKWERVDADYINIPYFFGDPVKMPVVKLRNRETGRRVYFANFHNPADSYGNAQRWRDKARRKQIALANRKFNEKVPLIITGDMNEREKYFCNMVAKAPMRAANGGSNPKDKPCNTPRPMGIDWIFGTRYISFSHYKKLESRLVRRTTDHPFVVTRAAIPRR
jgi:endonuclease/exonuclease/phosphatase family metal-dependent hydrolase